MPADSNSEKGMSQRDNSFLGLLLLVSASGPQFRRAEIFVLLFNSFGRS